MRPLLLLLIVMREWNACYGSPSCGNTDLEQLQTPACSLDSDSCSQQLSIECKVCMSRYPCVGCSHPQSVEKLNTFCGHGSLSAAAANAAKRYPDVAIVAFIFSAAVFTVFP